MIRRRSVYLYVRPPPYLGVSTLGLEGVHGQHVVAGGVQGDLALPILTTVIPDLENEIKFIERIGTLLPPSRPSVRSEVTIFYC